MTNVSVVLYKNEYYSLTYLLNSTEFAFHCHKFEFNCESYLK